MTKTQTTKTPAVLIAQNGFNGFSKGERITGHVVKAVWAVDSILTDGASFTETSFDIEGMNYQSGDFVAA